MPFFARSYAKPEPVSPLLKVKISISNAYFSSVETMGDFFNRIGQKRTLTKALFEIWRRLPRRAFKQRLRGSCLRHRALNCRADAKMQYSYSVQPSYHIFHGNHPAHHLHPSKYFTVGGRSAQSPTLFICPSRVCTDAWTEISTPAGRQPGALHWPDGSAGGRLGSVAPLRLSLSIRQARPADQIKSRSAIGDWAHDYLSLGRRRGPRYIEANRSGVTANASR